MKHAYLLACLLFSLFFFCRTAPAQTYQPDSTFQSPDFVIPGGELNAIARQADGKILLGGQMEFVNGTRVSHLARLHPDGSLDASFKSGLGDTRGVGAIKVLTGGKILVFYQSRLFRLNADGSRDDAFASKETNIEAVAVQADGKIITATWLNGSDGARLYRLVRLHSDGTTDASFLADAATTPAPGFVRALEVQSDGKILVGVQKPAGISHATSLIRLLADGKTDPAFSFADADTKFTLFSILPQSDGKILLGGTIEDGPFTVYLRRFLADGSADPGFQPAASLPKGIIFSLDRQADGKLLLGGWYYLPNPNTSPPGSYSFAQMLSPIIRLETDGSIDNSFTVDPQVARFAGNVMKVLPDGNILAGNNPGMVGLTAANSRRVNALVCLKPDGRVHEPFLAQVGVNGSLSQVLPQTGGKMVVTGFFNQAGNQKREGIARLHGDGSLDNTFTPDAALPPVGNMLPRVITQPDGKILVGGTYDNPNGQYKQLYRLHPDGRIDPGFNATGLDVVVDHLVLQEDQKIVVGGRAVRYGWKFSRLQPDGLEDQTYRNEAALSWSLVINAIALQSTGKILVVSGYQGYSLQPGDHRFVRLNADGSRDGSFSVPAFVTDSLDFIYSVIVQPDNKIVVSGSYQYNSRLFVFRLNENGSLDDSFAMNRFDRTYYTALLQPDGKVLLYGYEYEYESYTWQPKMIRLNGDGSPDGSFGVTGLTDGASVCSFLPDSKILVGQPGRLVRLRAVLNQAVLREQTITFSPIAGKLATDAPFVLTATASSGLPVAFSVVAGPATLAGNTVTLTGAGAVTIRASQAGDAAYKAAPAVEVTFEVSAVLGVEELTEAIRVYPNPSPGAFTVELPHALQGSELQLFNARGKVVYAAVVSTSAVIETGRLPAGIYLLRLQKGKLLVSRKVVVH